MIEEELPLRSRGTRRSPRSNRSRSGSRVSIDRGAQTQAEANEAASKIRSADGGQVAMAILRWLNSQPGSSVDLRAISEHLQEEEGRNNVPNQPREKHEGDTKGRRTSHEPYYLPVHNLPPDPMPQDPGPWGKGAVGKVPNAACVESPEYFLPGESSIPDGENSMRMFKVAKIFQCAFGTKKFTGKRTKYGEEGSITSLLEAFNRAQYQCPVTETEFVTFLTQAMYGEAQNVMSSYARKHRMGQMSIQEIYTALTDVYFTDLRPASALAKIRELNETNHPYHCLAEAQQDIARLCMLASLSARSKYRQEALAAEYYAQAIMRIIPKDFKAIASTIVQARIGSTNSDLNPEDIVECLESMRPQIDELFRKMQNRISANREAKVRRTEVRQNEGISEVEALLSNSHVTGHDANNPNLGRGENNRNTGGNRGYPPLINEVKPRGYSASAGTPCKLCGNPKHAPSTCPFFPDGKNDVASYECRTCRSGLYHYQKNCPRNSDDSKN